MLDNYLADYTWEPHTVDTDDGYKLVMFRLGLRDPHNDHGVWDKKEHRPSVLWMHRLGTDAVTTMAQFRQEFSDETPMPLKLVDDGYDVWMGNFRGTQYSSLHTSSDSNYNQSCAYWDWSFAELGIYDMKAFVDKIYEENEWHKVYILN